MDDFNETYAKIGVIGNITAMYRMTYNMELEFTPLLEKSLEELREIQDEIIIDYNKAVEERNEQKKG
jgi:hypothetical protein